MAAPNFVSVSEHVQNVACAMREFIRVIEGFNSRISPFVTDAPRDFDKCVNAGVAFLDERLGRKFWLERIDVASLDVASQTDCVVCQVTGSSYVVGVELLGGPALNNTYERIAWASKRGFAVQMCLDDVDHYARLTTAWIAKVRELRAESGTTCVATVAESDSVRITA